MREEAERELPNGLWKTTRGKQQTSTRVCRSLISEPLYASQRCRVGSEHDHKFMRLGFSHHLFCRNKGKEAFLGDAGPTQSPSIPLEGSQKASLGSCHDVRAKRLVLVIGPQRSSSRSAAVKRRECQHSCNMERMESASRARHRTAQGSGLH